MIKQPSPRGRQLPIIFNVRLDCTHVLRPFYIPIDFESTQEVFLMENMSVKKYLAELIGTMVLTLVGCGVAVVVGCSTPAGVVGTALAFGLSVVAMAYCIGRVSGCHINPAITIGMLIDKRIGTKDAVGYIVFQFIGAIIGAAVAGALLVEVLMTFIFVLAALGVTSTKATSAQAGIVIGLTLVLVHLMAIGLTGTSVNPARSFGPALMMLAEGSSLAIEQVWVFILAPVIGAIIAGIVWKVLKPEDDPEDA